MGCKMGFGQNIGWVGPSESHFTFDHVTRSMFSRVFADLFSYVTAAELSFTELRDLLRCYHNIVFIAVPSKSGVVGFNVQL